MTIPVEVRLAAALLVGGGLVFVLSGLLWLPAEGGGGGLLTLPLVQVVLAIAVAGGLLRGMRSARIGGTVLALLAAFLHLLIALQSAPAWVRIVSGLVAAAQVYAAVLLNTRPALQHSPGRRQ